MNGTATTRTHAAEMPLTESEARTYYSVRAPWLKPAGKELRGRCPIHGGDNDSAFHVKASTGQWKCETVCGGGFVFEAEAGMIGKPLPSGFADVKRSVYDIIGRSTDTPANRATVPHSESRGESDGLRDQRQRRCVQVAYSRAL
jgi:hypothetical protein